MVHVAVNKYDCEKNQHFRVRFWGGGGGHQKAYAVYAFINVDNCERPLNYCLAGSGDFKTLVNKLLNVSRVASCSS